MDENTALLREAVALLNRIAGRLDELIVSSGPGAGVNRAAEAVRPPVFPGAAGETGENPGAPGVSDGAGREPSAEITALLEDVSGVISAINAGRQGAPNGENRPASASEAGAEAVFRLGLALMLRRDYHGAVARFDEAIARDPAGERAYLNRGIAHRFLGESEKAVADYTRTVELNPENPEAYYLRGIANFSSRRYESARADLARARALGARVDPAVWKFLEGR